MRIESPEFELALTFQQVVQISIVEYLRYRWKQPGLNIYNVAFDITYGVH